MKKPHILLIHADQHRYDCLGPMGNRDVHTPALDALARDGTTYEGCVCPFPVCTPSRYSLLTGLYPHQHGAWSNHSTLAQGYPAFPKTLREAGYRTSCVGKMHFTPTYLDAGFDRMLLAEQDGPGRMEDDYHTWLMAQGRMDSFDIMDQRSEYRRLAPEKYWQTFGAGASDLPEDCHSTTWIGQEALRQVETWDTDTPQLLMVGFIKPHHPFDPPEEWLAKYDPATLTILPGWTDALLPQDAARQAPYFPNAPMNPATLRHVMACYYACISHMDHWIGRLIDTLRARGLYDDTLIVFTSDHGEYMGFHHMLLKFNNLYDPLVRIPLIVKKPGQRGEAARDSGLRPMTDLPASLLAWAGLANSPPLEDTPPRWVFSEIRMREGWHYMARSDQWKLIVWSGGQLFFDMEHDPTELHDLSDDPAMQPHIAEARAALADWLMFQTPPPSYLNEHAPCSGTPVQRSRDPQILTDYFQRAFTIPDAFQS